MQKISIRKGHTERGCWRVVSQDQVSVFGHNARTPDMWATRHDAIFRRVVTLLGSYYHRTKTAWHVEQNICTGHYRDTNLNYSWPHLKCSHWRKL
jgi:hypothetical protein